MKTIVLTLKDTPATRTMLAYLLENVTTQEMENAMSESEYDNQNDSMENAWRELECRIEEVI